MEGSRYWLQYYEFHRTADLAVAVVDRSSLPGSVRPLRSVKPNVVLDLGTDVATFGFPLTGRDRSGDKTTIRVSEVFLKGHVASRYDPEALAGLVERPFAQNYALSFESPEGLSGAPLLIKPRDGEPAVCGVIYGNKTTQFLIHSRFEEEEAGGRVSREETYRMHHFGLASGMAEFGEEFFVPTHLYEYPIQIVR